jgi:hypothetical protein
VSLGAAKGLWRHYTKLLEPYPFLNLQSAKRSPAQETHLSIQRIKNKGLIRDSLEDFLVNPDPDKNVNILE